jgi:UPF0176 protein
MNFQIITFYEFRKLNDLERIRDSLKTLMAGHSVFGTIIIAGEGFNATVCGTSEDITEFVPAVEEVFETKIEYKSSFHEENAFRRRKVKIKPEIVTLRKDVEIGKGTGTHVDSRTWNKIISDEETLVLDTRNDYEYRVGTFKNAVNPQTASFTELPEFVEKNLDPEKHKRIAMFCTGGIRCEKFAPYLVERGFVEVFQLDGGILRYLEETPSAESLWEGECFVFDERVTVDENLQKGSAADLSGETKK